MSDLLTLNDLPTPPEALRPCLRDLLLAQGSTSGLVDDAELVAEEVIVNVREHGGVAGGAQIRLQAQADPAGITLRFEDNGRAFDPLSEIAPADLGATDEQRCLGGFGFHLVRQLCHSLRYDRHDGRNCLELRLQPAKEIS